MRPVAPRIVGIEEFQYDGDEYKSLTFAIIPTEEGLRGYVMRWQPTSEERDAIMRGEDLFLITIGRLPPHIMHVGYPFGEIEP